MGRNSGAAGSICNPCDADENHDAKTNDANSGLVVMVMTPRMKVTKIFMILTMTLMMIIRVMVMIKTGMTIMIIRLINASNQ